MPSPVRAPVEAGEGASRAGGWGQTGRLPSTSSFLIAAVTTYRALTLSQALLSALQAWLLTHHLLPGEYADLHLLDEEVEVPERLRNLLRAARKLSAVVEPHRI